MLGCMMPMSSPMMKRMLGLAAGACAYAGRLVAGRLSAASATLETSRLPILRLTFMILDPPLRVFDQLLDLSIFRAGAGASPWHLLYGWRHNARRDVSRRDRRAELDLGPTSALHRCNSGKCDRLACIPKYGCAEGRRQPPADST